MFEAFIEKIDNLGHDIKDLYRLNEHIRNKASEYVDRNIKVFELFE